MNRPQLVIFDCDGVLVDSEPIANRLLQQALGSLGLHLTLDELLARFTGRSFRDLAGTLAAELPQPAPPGFWRALQERTFAAFERELQPLPGAAELLQWLPPPCCVASSGSRAKIQHSLRITGLDKWFERERIFSAAEVAVGKPAPDLFLLAARRCGVAPADCLVVEDSLPGVQAGLAAGMSTLLLASRPGVPVPPGVVRISALAEIRRLLET